MTSEPLEPGQPTPAGGSDQPNLIDPTEAQPAPPLAPVGAPPPSTSHRTRMLVNAVLGIALVVLVGGVGFAAGRATAPDATFAGNDGGFIDDGLRPGNGTGGFGQIPGGNGNTDGIRDGQVLPGFGGVNLQGTVTAIDADSINLELANGGSVEIAIDSSTDYHRRAEASASDVTAGATVIVGIDALRGPNAAGATASDVTIVP